MPEQKYSSLDEYYNGIVRQFVDDCTLCGECVRSCPVYPLGPSKDKTPDELMEKMMNFLRDGIFSEEVYTKAFTCAGCGSCTDACPAGIDPSLVHEATKSELVKKGKTPPEVLNFILPGQKMNLYRILSALQIKPSEKRWLDRMPTQPKKTENVVFLGCTFPAFPHEPFALLDILEKMGVEFTALGGGDEFCCGVCFSPCGGMVKNAEEKGRKFVENLKAFSPKRVILACIGCYRQFTEFYPKFLDLDFEVEYSAEYLIKNMDKIKFTKPLDKTIAFHNACMVRRVKMENSVRKVIENIPGLNVIKDEKLCCGGLANMIAPEVGKEIRQNLIEDLNKTKADCVASVCFGCQLGLYSEFRKDSFGMKHFVSLVHEAMGGKRYEDKLEKYWKCKSVDELIEKTRENFEANGYSEGEMRHILPMIFELHG